MGKRLKVLNVEDSEADANLVNLHLTHAGYEINAETVDTAETMSSALKAKEWDIILCDYSMPHFNALLALDVLRQSGLDIPFIIISGTVGEEVAVQAMLTGAHDYLSKSNLTRLVPAVERELHQAQNRREKHKAEIERRLSDDRYRALFDYAPDGIIISSPNDYYLDANPSMCEMLGYDHNELVGMHASDIVIRSEARELDSEFALVQSSLDYNREWHFRRKDGSEFPGEVIATIMPDGNLLAMIRDVSERNTANAALLESEEKFSSAFELAPIGVALVLPDGSWLKVNKALCSLTGYTEAELLDLTFQDITHPDDLKQDLLNVRRLLKGKTSHYQMEKRYIHKLGHIVFVSISVSLVRRGDDEPRYFIAQIQDITERKLAEDELRESEALLAASQRITHLGSWVMDISDAGEIIENTERWSDEHYRIFGFEPGEIEVTDESFYNSVHPDDREPVAKMLRATVEHQKPYDLEHRIILPDGTERIVHAMAEAVHDAKTGKVQKLLGSVQDITDRKRAEKDSRRRQTELRILFDVIPAMIWFKDTDNNILRVNNQVAIAAGLSVEEIEGRPAHEIYPNESAKFYADDLKVLESGKPRLGYEEMLPGPDGEKRWVQTNKVPYFDNDGKAIGIVVMAQDVTERKKADEALAKSEEQYRELVENALDIIYTLDLEGNYTSVNDAGERITGYSREQTLAHNISHTVAPEDQERGRHFHAEQLAGRDVVAFELEVIAKGGRRVVLEINTRSITENGVVVGVQGIARDITERKRADAEIKEKSALLEAQLNSSIDGILIVDENGKQIIQNQRIVDIFKIPQHIADDRNDAEQVKWVTALMKEPEKFINRVLHLYANPQEISRDEIELKDGTILDRYSAPVIGKDNKNYGRIWTFRDITENKRAQAAVRESNEKFHQLADNISDVFWVRSLDMKEVYYVSPAFEKIWGRSVSSLLDDPTKWPDYVFPEDSSRVKTAYADLQNDSSPLDIEYRIVRPDDSIRWVRVRGFPVKDTTGMVIRYAGIVSDITDRKKDAEAFIESEARYRELVENAIDIIYTHDLKGNYTSVNRAGEMITGYSNAEILAMNMADILAPAYLGKAKQMLAEKLAGNETTAYEVELVAKAGHRVALEVNTRIVYEGGVAVGVQGIARDITERKLLDARISRLVNSNAQGVFFWNTKGEVTGGNEAFLTIIGYTREEMDAGRVNWVALTPPEYVPLDQIALDQLAASGTCSIYEKEFLKKDGSRVHILLGAAMLENDMEEGVCFVLDITERKRGEAALEESEASFRSLFDTANDAIMVLDEGVFIDCNHRAELLFGCSRDWIIGRSPMELSPPIQPDGSSSSGEVTLYIAPALEGTPQFYEWQHLRKDGSLFDAEVSLNRV
ncbi:MAG: PAS domain S-box protein, partial [Pyrinomonadaceae bacterium]